MIFISGFRAQAAQCSELECLIPLQYCASKLILVGDPKQLPATVKSRVRSSFKLSRTRQAVSLILRVLFLQKAQDMEWGQSLFERLFSFLNSPNYESPVQMLDTQYRMHPEIVRFPSQLMYDGVLKTDR